MRNDYNYDTARTLFQNNNLELSKDKYDKLALYADMLISESDRQNVTAVHDIPEIWSRHFLDSAYLCQFLPFIAFSLIDIGTGGGIPGIPLAILLDHSKVTLLDSERNKIAFCESCVKKLALDVTCISGRAEEIAKLSAYREQFDFAVSRAMASGSMLCELSLPFLKVHGSLFAMKGKNYNPEVERFEQAASSLSANITSETGYSLEGESKHLIFVEKLAETPAQYPRRFAKMKRQPL